MQSVDRAVVVDGIIEIEPIRYTTTDPKTGRPVTATQPISFISVRDFIIKLKGHFPHLHLAAFDRWNSPELIEELIRKRIDAEALIACNLAFELGIEYEQSRIFVWG